MPTANRRTFMKTTGAIAVFHIASSRILSAQDRPNILWILGEDVSPDIGCYGDPLVRTPHIDRLAEEGVRFENAFATCPVCSPARSALHTGMYQTTVGAHHHRSHREDDFRLPEGAPLITHRFQQAGYLTANIKPVDEHLKGTGKTDWNFHVDHPFDTDQWDDLKGDQPFFAQINFPEAHRSFKRSSTHPVAVDEVELPPYYPDHPITRLDWAAYLDTVGRLDEKVGAVLHKLEADGLAENTVVIFMGDHGRCQPRGKQFLYEGGIRIPVIIRYPQRFQPGTVNPDLIRSIDLTATTLDMAGIPLPDTLQGQSLLDPRAPKHEYIVAARDRCDETVDRIRCIRTQRFKYIRNVFPDRPYTQLNRYKETQYPTLRLMRRLKHEGKLTDAQSHFMADTRPQQELYDLQNDPHEIHNLAASEKHQITLKALQTKLDQWMETNGDLGAIPEDPAIAERYKQQMMNIYDKQLRQQYQDENMDLAWIGLAS